MGEKIKDFLFGWCGKKKLDVNYDYRMQGTKQRQRFICECKISIYEYRAVGNSTNKKDAGNNAARDMIQYLIRSGQMKEQEVPGGLALLSIAPMSAGDGGAVMGGQSFGTLPTGILAPHLTQHGGGMGGSTGINSGRGGGMMSNPAPYQPGPPRHYMEAITNKRLLEEAEEADFTAELHGNWTLENAKSRLHQFLQTLHIKADYKYSQTGPDHNRYRGKRVIELTLYMDGWDEKTQYIQ